MRNFNLETLFDLEQDGYRLKDYCGNVPRWCPGCGDNAILAAVQRVCRDEQLSPEQTVFVSGIGCSSRFPHYIKTYGFHGLHGRALPLAQGIKIRRPDLSVFVNMGDGDCCSIGTAHWIHAVRYNMNMVAMVHDNGVYGLTKKQASPTSPQGLKTNTTPLGAFTEPLNPTSTTLGVANVSFVAQAVEWMPDVLHDILREAYHHRGFAFVRIMQRCPHFTPHMFDDLLDNPEKLLVLTHDKGISTNDALKRVYPNHAEHDPSDIHKAREYASLPDQLAVGILYRNERVPVYEDLRRNNVTCSPQVVEETLNREFDKFAIKSAEDGPAEKGAKEA